MVEFSRRAYRARIVVGNFPPRRELRALRNCGVHEGKRIVGQGFCSHELAGETDHARCVFIVVIIDGICVAPSCGAGRVGGLVRVPAGSTQDARVGAGWCVLTGCASDAGGWGDCSLRGVVRACKAIEADGQSG